MVEDAHPGKGGFYFYDTSGSSPVHNYTDYWAFGDGYGYYDYSYDEFPYPGFDFERPVYLYIWVIMVIVTTIFNILMIIVLLGRRMQNATNTVLIGIAVTDSLTGLVTLPTYIYVYQQFVKGDAPGEDAYNLSETWCKAFMISKFFLSKSFHTMSIWLTVLLGAQRCIAVCLPFKAKRLVSVKNNRLIIAIICLLSPVLHVYHLVDEKTSDYMCGWTLEKPCQEGCAYIWLTFLLMHFIPCTLLVVLTALLVRGLKKTTRNLGRMTNSTDGSRRRAKDNRQLSIIVVAVVIVFLVPEILYGIFLLISVIKRQSGLQVMSLDVNRALHLAYEVLLLLSFHANFWVYTLMCKSFRDQLKSKLRQPVELLFGGSTSDSRVTSETCVKTVAGQTSDSNTQPATEMTILSPEPTDSN